MQEPQKQDEAAQEPHQGKAYKDMTAGEKVRWILKLSISIISFGILFPNVMSD